MRALPPATTRCRCLVNLTKRGARIKRVVENGTGGTRRSLPPDEPKKYNLNNTCILSRIIYSETQTARKLKRPGAEN